MSNLAEIAQARQGMAELHASLEAANVTIGELCEDMRLIGCQRNACADDRDRLTAELAEATIKLTEVEQVTKKILAIRWGWDGDAGANNYAKDIIEIIERKP